MMALKLVLALLLTAAAVWPEVAAAQAVQHGAQPNAEEVRPGSRTATAHRRRRTTCAARRSDGYSGCP